MAEAERRAPLAVESEVTEIGDYHWSISGCDSRVWWYGEPGRGAWYWTNRYGQYWVSGTVHWYFGWYGYECPHGLGPPLHPYGYIQEFGGGEGQWFERGCIIYRYSTGGWTTYWGDYGQSWGRLVHEPFDESRFEERPVEKQAPAPAKPIPKTPKAPPPPVLKAL